MFINVRVGRYNESRLINVENIDYIQDLNMNVFTEFKSEIVFKDKNTLATSMYKHEILDLVNKVGMYTCEKR